MRTTDFFYFISEQTQNCNETEKAFFRFWSCVQHIIDEYISYLPCNANAYVQSKQFTAL